MTLLTSLFFLLVGLVLLVGGAEYLVRGASSAAKKWGVSGIVIGLTVVSFGTSMPELLVNLISATKGSTDLAIGNIVGSNIANIFLILGVTAIMTRLHVKENTMFKEIPFALLAIVLVFLMGNDAMFDGAGENVLSRTDGFAFLSLFIIFLYYTYGISKVMGEKESVATYSWPKSLGMFGLGLAALAFGGNLIVDNAVEIARIAGMSERIIGLTIVAIGTSLPELATSVVAAMKGHADIAIGNAVGSNIFNVFWILGLTSIIAPIPFSVGINIDVLFASFATFLLFLFVFMFKKHELDRWMGLTFLFLYIGYLIFLVMAPFCLPIYCGA